LPHPATFHPLKPELPVGHTFIELQTVDSTNNYAMAQVHAGLALPGTVYFAQEQFAGKGQRGKTWSTTKGENIIMSIVLRPNSLRIDLQFALSASLAIACHDLLAAFSPGNFFIKWPNDLYWCDRKAGGILIENILHGDKWEYAIAGIGININQSAFEKNLPNPVSLGQVTKKKHDCIELAKQLCVKVEKRYQELLEGKEEELIGVYNTCLYKRNKQARLKKGELFFDTIIKEVSTQGRLITRDKEERSFDFGECQWIL
jgi:BirA family transcriptional regulator, biotin operon repressor / biotin---[acetyl-CoA-carboxylase] ligase